MTMTLEDVVTATKAKRVNGGYLGTCPIHNDTTASLSIRAGDKQPIVVNCLAGCDWKEVRNALGISRSPNGNGNGTSPDELHYGYRDLSEKVSCQVVRKPPKVFSIRRPDGNGGWIYGLGDVPRIPYDLPELSEAIALGKTVYVVEGEKDCESLKSLGLTATTNIGGAGWKWTREFAEHFRGAIVRVIPDNDDAGRAHAADVIEKLTGIAESVTLVELPGVREKGDVSDWLMMGGSAEQLESSGTIVPKPAADTEDAPVFLSLSVLMQRPELLVPPQYAIPRLSTRGRATLLVAPDKSGKSTLLAHAASEASRRGHFLGEAIDASHGRVIWAGLEEALGDAVRRFNDLGALPHNIQLVVLQSEKLLEHIRELAGNWNADVLCLDSLTEYARVVRGTVPEDGDSSGWASVIRPLVALTREFPNLSAIFTHHPRRTDGQYRGSGEIAAAVDCLLEMRNPTPTEDPNLRHVTGRARWPVESFDIAFVDGRYELAGGAPMSTDVLTLMAIQNNRGISQDDLRKKVGGRAKDVDRAVEQLIQRGAVLDLRMGKKHAYHPAASATSQGNLEGVK